MKQNLSIESLIKEAKLFCKQMSNQPHEQIRGVTDGKSVGDYFEKLFKEHILQKYTAAIGSSASGIDFPDPEVNTDIKVTSIRQPQSSAPFRSFRQKIYGLGYNILLFVYDKDDNKTYNVTFLHARFIYNSKTGDFITTKGLKRILEEGGNLDDIKAFILERVPYIDDLELENIANVSSNQRVEWVILFFSAIKYFPTLKTFKISISELALFSFNPFLSNYILLC